MLVHNKGNYIRYFGDVRLLPGANELDEKQAKEFSEQAKNKLNAAVIDRKEVVVASTGKGKEAASLEDLNANDAMLLIADTFDLVLLEKWLTDENKGKKRVTVIKAIEEQADEIKNPNPDDVVNQEE